MLSLSEVCGSRYLLFHALCDAGFSMVRSAAAVRILLGPETAGEYFDELSPYVPTDAEWANYCQWSDRLDAMTLDDRDPPAPDCVITDADIVIMQGGAG